MSNLPAKKFITTDKETNEHTECQRLPTLHTVEDELTEDEFLLVIGKLKSNKVVGPDDVSAEVYKTCSEIHNELFRILHFIW